jgi:hypothetical protein
MERPYRSVAPRRPRWNARQCRWTLRSYASIEHGQAALLWITLKVEKVCKDTKAGALNPGSWLASMRRISACCARAASGHPAAEQCDEVAALRGIIPRVTQTKDSTALLRCEISVWPMAEFGHVLPLASVQQHGRSPQGADISAALRTALRLKTGHHCTDVLLMIAAARSPAPALRMTAGQKITPQD